MKTKSHFSTRPNNKYQKWKDTVIDIESSIDPQVFLEFEVAYDHLIKDLSKIKDGFKTTANNLLLDYLSHRKGVERDERLEEMQEKRRI